MRDIINIDYFNIFINFFLLIIYLLKISLSNCFEGIALLIVRAIILYNLNSGYLSSPLFLYNIFLPLSSINHELINAAILFFLIISFDSKISSIKKSYRQQDNLHKSKLKLGSNLGFLSSK